MMTPTIAHPPETLEGWYALHQILRFTKQKPDATRLARLVNTAGTALESRGSKRKTSGGKASPTAGWSCFARLIGSTSDLMVIHFRESLDAIGAAQQVLAGTELGKMLQPTYAFLSVTEAGLYHITAELARAAEARGGKVGDAGYLRTLAGRAIPGPGSEPIRPRLYPP